jgi:hypothetical protein
MYEQYQADLLPDHIYIKNLDTLPWTDSVLSGENSTVFWF